MSNTEHNPELHYQYSPYSGHTLITNQSGKCVDARFDGYTYLEPLQPGDTVEYGRQY